jgi:hypothetical protein
LVRVLVFCPCAMVAVGFGSVSVTRENQEHYICVLTFNCLLNAHVDITIHTLRVFVHCTQPVVTPLLPTRLRHGSASPSGQHTTPLATA